MKTITFLSGLAAVFILLAPVSTIAGLSPSYLNVGSDEFRAAAGDKQHRLFVVAQSTTTPKPDKPKEEEEEELGEDDC